MQIQPWLKTDLTHLFDLFQLQLPTNFTFAEAFDLFFKLHFVINIHYGDSIKTMMEFIEAFFYETGMIDTTDLMDQVFETLDAFVRAE